MFQDSAFVIFTLYECMYAMTELSNSFVCDSVSSLHHHVLTTLNLQKPSIFGKRHHDILVGYQVDCVQRICMRNSECTLGISHNKASNLRL